jgi:hypothetical protein
LPHPAVRVVEFRQEQQSLPLPDAPDSESSLRGAFERSPLRALGYTFERALRDELIRRCLVNVNLARLRARSEQAGRA